MQESLAYNTVRSVWCCACPQITRLGIVLDATDAPVRLPARPLASCSGTIPSIESLYVVSPERKLRRSYTSLQQILAANVKATPLRPFSSQENGLPGPLVHAPVDHTRLLHHAQACGVFFVHDCADVEAREWGPEGRSAPTGGEDGGYGLGRVAFVPADGEEVVGDFEG